ncbi:hypothetical protein UCDDA912_g03542 [Diaporthe ampelina]|uniref:Uncharacterized protein n=1 Tax=Diaporthe ampelina TaxID=1214573 RepID=A0A0G2FR37_9PEZI|nr:hypothetical protein UCDDA912_g03542 [Diaporthe ampelina]
MANQSKEDNGIVPSNTLVSKLLAVLPVEIRLHIYEDVFRGSRIYAEARPAYWSSTVIDSALNPPFDSDDFSQVLRTIPVFSRPRIREIWCKGFREYPGLNFKQFVDRFARVERLVMEPAFLYVSRRFYRESTWSAGMVINRAQRDLRKCFPMFGPDGLTNIRGDIQVLQRVQFPVIVRSRGMQIRLAAKDKTYPAKVRLQSVSVKIFFINHFKGLMVEGNLETPDEVGFQKVL